MSIKTYDVYVYMKKKKNEKKDMYKINIRLIHEFHYNI